MSVLCAPKTCSTRARMRDRLRLTVFFQSSNGRLWEALRCIRLVRPRLGYGLQCVSTSRRCRPTRRCHVVRRKQLIKHLAVMHRRVRHPVAPYQFVSTIDADVILVAIVALAVLLRPARLRVLLATLGRHIRPGLGRLVTLDLLVSSRPLRCTGTATIDASMIWPPPGSVPLAFEMGVEILEQGLDEASL